MDQIDISGAHDLHAQQAATFLDMRDPESFHAGHIPGAVHLHDRNLAQVMAQTPRDKTVVVYCYHGNASRGGAEFLVKEGFQAVSMMGGFTAWSGAEHPVQSTADAASPPEVTVSDEARAQLEGFMGGEAEGTRVRLTLEQGRFGLALDEARSGDLSFETAGLPFVIEATLAAPASGLTLGWDAAAGGFTLEGGSPPPAPAAPGREAMRAEIEQLVTQNKITIFLKGTAGSPMCGFSARAIQILQSLGKPFADKNALEHPEYRYVLTEYSDWPTLPQVFVAGKLVGGSDILNQLHESGELGKLVEEAFA